MAGGPLSLCDQVRVSGDFVICLLYTSFTQPDKPQGRGYKLMPPPVKVCALENGLSVYQPAKMRDGQALALLKELSPELIVVVAYGKILPPDILELPPLGCVNVHGSLLPKYRGCLLYTSVKFQEEKLRPA